MKFDLTVAQFEPDLLLEPNMHDQKAFLLPVSYQEEHH